MHELGIMTGVLDAATDGAERAGAESVSSIRLVVGDMTEVIEDALTFAFDALKEGGDYPLFADCTLELVHVAPKSRCRDCGEEFVHDRFARACPACGSYATDLVAGRELHIDSIEVELPDEEDTDADADQASTPDAAQREGGSPDPAADAGETG